MGFDLKNYETVETRIERFYLTNPTGRIVTELVYSDEKRCEFKASLYLDESPVVKATGYAQETVSGSGVNKTNHYENCETSAIGRALANANYAPKGARPSQEEMSKTQASIAAQSPIMPPEKVQSWLKKNVVAEDDSEPAKKGARDARCEVWASFVARYGADAEKVLLGCDDLQMARSCLEEAA